jgi:hypothetical protein
MAKIITKSVRIAAKHPMNLALGLAPLVGFLILAVAVIVG